MEVVQVMLSGKAKRSGLNAVLTPVSKSRPTGRDCHARCLLPLMRVHLKISGIETTLSIPLDKHILATTSIGAVQPTPRC